MGQTQGGLERLCLTPIFCCNTHIHIGDPQMDFKDYYKILGVEPTADDKAIKAADQVRRWGDIVELEPMNSYDRRIIHNALKDDLDIETHSVEVDGTHDKAIILRPKS